MHHLFDTLLQTWQTATLTDYAHCVLAIVIIAWFATRSSK